MHGKAESGAGPGVEQGAFRRPELPGLELTAPEMETAATVASVANIPVSGLWPHGINHLSATWVMR